MHGRESFRGILHALILFSDQYGGVVVSCVPLRGVVAEERGIHRVFEEVSLRKQLDQAARCRADDRTRALADFRATYIERQDLLRAPAVLKYLGLVIRLPDRLRTIQFP